VSGPKRDDVPRFGGAEDEAFAGAPEGSPPAPVEPEAEESSDEPATDDEHEDTDDLARAQAQAKEYLDHLRRLQAEFDNYRKRVLKEQTRAVELASEPVMRRLLEVVDDFELALMSANDKPDFDRFLHGVELVFAKLMDTLRAEGLERIEAKGRPFDPERHEALLQTGDGDADPMVADVLRPGYTLRGRVLRPAGVRVERK
jgi:molecular chaperone GrpE